MFGGLLKNISRLTLGIFTVRSLFSKLRSSIKDGIDNLAQYSAKTNKALSALKSSYAAEKLACDCVQPHTYGHRAGIDTAYQRPFKGD